MNVAAAEAVQKWKSALSIPKPGLAVSSRFQDKIQRSACLNRSSIAHMLSPGSPFPRIDQPHPASLKHIWIARSQRRSVDARDRGGLRVEFSHRFPLPATR